ncbi:MAG: DUF2326 domain-containing protein [Thermoplasmatales archaeon]|nr:DUF2326 domain-containing protein [Candidatus Methanoperedenaceae archaeon]MCG2825503.1 DUF2326 domain-containing protein [Thermoplasmatales archaeon]
MIHRIYSDLKTFKTLELHQGLNVLLADKSPGATDQQTRNRAGKTSLIEILHFLAGADCKKDALKKDSIFKVKELINYTFGMEFDLKNKKIAVERNGQKPNEIIIKGDTSEWPRTYIERRGKHCAIAKENWRNVLGAFWFKLVFEQDEEELMKFGPTFRSLFSYFVRKENDGGFISPIKQSMNQRRYDSQVAISFLLGIDWSISQKWQIVRMREDTLKELRKAVGAGAFGDIIGTVAKLRTELAVAEEKNRRLSENIKNFHVLPEYRDLENTATEITQNLGKLSNDNLIDKELIVELRRSFENETPPKLEDIRRIYAEAGVALPGIVLRRYEDLEKFHKSVIENRNTYLSGEIERAQEHIRARDQDMSELSKRLKEIMEILNSHGALDQFKRLQSELSKVEVKTEAVRQKFIAAEQLEGKKTELELERGRLLIRLRQNYQEQRHVVERAILSFEEMSKSLYEEAGQLTISATTNGPEFEIGIQGDKSKGIRQMQIFCFDMMLMHLCTERGLGPGFLVHDSHLFDGVDERQVATALKVGSEMANKLGFQYIVTMNSDNVPKESRGFNVNDYVLPVRLTDAKEDGGLFGTIF